MQEVVKAVPHGASNGQDAPAHTETKTESSDPVLETKSLLAERIRAVRRANDMSIADLARGADVTPALASQIERGVTSPSISTLVRMAAVLRVSVAELFQVEHPASAVVRYADRQMMTYPEPEVSDQVIASDPTRQLLVLESRIGPGRTSGELSSHGAEVECVIVLEGSIDMIVGTETHSLNQGDTLTFQGRHPHGFSNKSNDVVKLIWIMTPANY